MRLVAAAVGMVMPVSAQEHESTHILPFFPAASETGPQGFVRVVNNSDEAGVVAIVAVDDAGSQFDGLTLELDANATANLDADGLESGAPEVGLTGSTGGGQGDWRLGLSSDLEIELQAFARTPDGALWEMHETAPEVDGAYRVVTFNPGVNVHQVGRLRLVNPGDVSATVTIRGTDDDGESPGEGVSVEIAPGEASSYTAAELESGSAPGLEGGIGDGEGKWRLTIESSIPIRVMSLIASPTGHLTNLSAIPARVSGGVHRIPLFPPTSDPYGRQGFARVVNRSDVAGEVRIEAFDGTARTYEALTLALGVRETRHFNSDDLEYGNEGKKLAGSTGAGEGDWHLELTTELDIQVLSYVRTVGGQGYVTPMHDTTAREAAGLMRYYVPVFHPAGHDEQESRLHLMNLGSGDVQVGIGGLDEAGRLAPEGDVSLSLAGGETRVLTSAQLEDGHDGLDGRLGRGSGSWRLFVTADGDLQVMNLGYAADGFLANLSRGRPPATVEAANRPDLVVAEPSASNLAPPVGTAFTLAVTVTNRGAGNAGATGLTYYRSANAHISASDTQVGTDRVEPLPSGESSRESTAVTAGEPGTHYYGACAEAVADESDTANNCSSAVAVTVPRRRPDLTVRSLTVSDSEPPAGGPFTLSASVHNTGAGASEATTLRYFRSADSRVTAADAEVGTDAVASLGAGASSAGSTTLSAPVADGTYYYGACVDEVADESDTANNCSSAVSVDVVSPPDLSVDLVIGVSDAVVDLEESVVLNTTVANVGTRESPATSLAYYFTASSTARYMLDEAFASPALDISASHTQSITRVAGSEPLVTHYYLALLQAVEGEENFSNNSSTTSFVTRELLDDVGVSVPAGCGKVELCFGDWACGDGDSIQVDLNGSTVFSGELTTEALGVPRWQCVVASVSAGANTLEVVALNGTGFKGEGCSHVDANTPAVLIRSGDSQVRQNLMLESITGFTRTTATITVAEDGSGSCPNSAMGIVREVRTGPSASAAPHGAGGNRATVRTEQRWGDRQ